MRRWQSMLSSRHPCILRPWDADCQALWCIYDSWSNQPLPRSEIMARLFIILTILNLLALTGAFVLGCLSKFVDNELFYLSHFNVGLFAAVLTLLVHCIIFTYFLGTGRWVKEVGLAYRLADGGLPKQTRELKRSVFPPALYAMLITIAASAAGMGAKYQGWPWLVHGSMAVITLAVNVWAARVELQHLRANAAILDAVLSEVDRIRAEHGLPSNAEALREEQR